MKTYKELLIERWERIGISKKVIAAFKKVPRENFVMKEYKQEAYEDIALPIIEGQTISQPSTIVHMLDLLDVKENSKVLEIGAGSGYNAALLSKLTKKKVITVERIEKLAELAKKNLKRSKIKNVEVIHADGAKGHKKEAPYDRIIATCGAKEIPKAWKDQLKEKGILVAPIGYHEQEMIAAKKTKGELKTEKKGLFRFVPLVSNHRQFS